jgi:hypothetical protein
MIRLRNIAAGCAIGVVATQGVAETIMVDYTGPSLDRWMYPFNFTNGTRSSASTFGALNEPDFDNRDGQFIVGWDTGADITAGMGESAYTILSAVVHVATDQGGFIYDESYDAYQTYLLETDGEFVADGDPGRPITLFGVGFRNGFDVVSFLENSPWGPSSSTYRQLRNAYATDFVMGVAEDVSINVDQRFDPAPFAVGAAPVTPGAAVPADTDFTFDINVNDEDVQAYFKQALDSGRIRLVLTSLHPAVEQGGVFVSWYTKENLFGAGFSARLSLTVRVGPAADLNGDGVVDGMDLAALLAGWGGAGASDLNGDGTTDGMDLAALLAEWTP